MYLKKLSFPVFLRSCIDTGAIINNINGEIIFSGKFNSRRNLSINITNGKLIIGKNVFCNQNVSINCRSMISIGDNTIIGEDTKFYDHNHRFRPTELIKDQGFKTKAINIGKNVWLGSNVIVLSGVTIGDNSVVSAGSVVYDDIPANMILKNNRLTKIVEKGIEQ